MSEIDTLGADTGDSATVGRSFGPVTVRPGDPLYPELIVGNNQRWTAAPEAIELVGSTDQVVRALQRAVSARKRISVRSGGHCYEDFVSNSKVQIIIDLSGMTAVYYDRNRKAFAVEAGARLLNVYEALYKGWGVTLPGGTCYSVGAGGHIAGGGYGLLSRAYGLTVDHLYGVEVVVVDATGTARPVVATREATDPNTDLFWAHTGGGGGNFGIVTRYWFRSPGPATTDPTHALPRPPATVLLNGVGFPWADIDQREFTALAKNWGSWHAANSSPKSPYRALSGFLTLTHQSAGGIGLLAQIDGTIPNADQLLSDFINAITDGVNVRQTPITHQMGEFGAMPQIATAQRLPWLNSARFLGTNTPVLTNPTLRADHKAAYMRKNFPDSQVEALYNSMTRTDFSNPNAMALLISYGGNVNAVPATATAVAQRDSVFKVLFQVFWSDQTDDAVNLGWIRESYRDVYASTGGVPVPNDVTDGCFINYPDTDLSDPAWNMSGVPWYTLYYKDNYPRLQRVKAKWDPRNIFRHTQGVEA